MTPEEIVANWYDSQFNLIDEKAVNDLIRLIQSALAERTEQCAKIAENGLVAIGSERPNILLNPFSSHRVAIAKAIRALNQPETKS